MQEFSGLVQVKGLVPVAHLARLYELQPGTKLGDVFACAKTLAQCKFNEQRKNV